LARCLAAEGRLTNPQHDPGYWKLNEAGDPDRPSFINYSPDGGLQLIVCPGQDQAITEINQVNLPSTSGTVTPFTDSDRKMIAAANADRATREGRTSERMAE
jgi:hypothetical protein